MRTYFFGTVGLLATLASSMMAGCQNGAAGGRSMARVSPDVREAIADARDRVFPALVNVEVVTLEYAGGKEQKNRGTGSGTILSKEGYVLTNAHVTDKGKRFWCTLSDKQRIPATMVGEDPWTDLAVIKLDLSRLLAGTELSTGSLGDSNTLTVGDYVLAMGSPFSLSRTVTLGIVSNTERVFTSAGTGQVDEMLLNWEQRTGLFTNWIQHDALINPGNSGGPLVNLRGEVIGVNTRGGSGMAFATPSNMARQVADALIAQGDVKRSSIGASFRHLQNTGLSEGVLVDSVDADGPAHAAGLRAGDVIRQIAGESLTVRFVEEIPPLLKQLADRPIGGPVEIVYDRGETKGQTVTVVTEPLRRDRGDEQALRTWGVTVQQITNRMAKEMRLSSTRGAMISSVRSGGPAANAEPSLGWGDVIVSIDGKPLEQIGDIVQRYEEVDGLKEKPEYVLIEFERGNKNYVTLIKPRPEERPDPPAELPKAWVGIATQPVLRNMAEMLGHPDQRGFRIMRVYTGTNAAKAGLEVGDIVLTLNGEKLEPRGIQDAGALTRAVRRLSIDSSATLSVLREGKVIDVPVSLERTRIESQEAARARNADFELAVREITFFDREDYRWDETVSGVLVESAEPAGWAGLAGVRGGDLIQKIGDHEVKDSASFKRAMEQIGKDQPGRVVFVVFRGSRTYFRFAEPDWKPTTEVEPKE